MNPSIKAHSASESDCIRDMALASPIRHRDLGDTLYLADLYEDPAEALIWDIRALDAADGLKDERAQQHHASLQVAGFYPSLFLNIADNLRCLGAFEAAAEHISSAEQHTSALSDDAYGDTIRTAIHEVHQAIDNRDTARRASAPGAA